MFAFGRNPLYRRLLATSYRPYSRIEIWRSGVRIDNFGDAGVPKLDGSVSATLTSQVARTAAFTVDESLVPTDVTDPAALLAPWGNEARIFAGISYAGGTFEAPVFRGRINAPTYTLSGANMTVNCTDLAGGIQDSNFVIPVNSAVRQTIAEQYVSLISDADPTATFGGFDTFAQMVPALVWTSDRASACDDLANSAGAFWYPLADGTFTMKTVPWTVISDPVFSYTNGSGGAILDASIATSRDNVYNQIIITGERADGSTPVYAVAQDLNPASPTYIKGPFGIKSLTIQVQSATTNAQAFQLATSWLQRTRSLTQNWTASVPPDPALELGDVGLLTAGSRQAVQVVSGFTYPLVGSSTMSVTFRALTPAYDSDNV